MIVVVVVVIVVLGGVLVLVRVVVKMGKIVVVLVVIVVCQCFFPVPQQSLYTCCNGVNGGDGGSSGSPRCKIGVKLVKLLNPASYFFPVDVFLY